MATLCAETNAVIKLDVGGKGGIRRIALAKLWDPTTSRVSYQRLSEMALEYSNLSDLKIRRVTVTYTDEDGDSITISTDDELTDAFEQFATRVPPVVRAKASFEVKKDAKKIVKDLKEAVSEIGETAKEDEGGNKKPKADQMQGVLDSFLTMLTQAVDSLSKNVEGMQQRKKNCSEAIPKVPKEIRARNIDHKSNAVLKKREKRPQNTEKEIIDKISATHKADAACKEQGKPKDEDVSPVVEEEQEKCSNILPVKTDLDKRFIHGRHTCDGCLLAPIIGIRYHAINLPDHDLCEKCVLKHTRKDVIFEATELERDRYIQNKWKRRQWRQSREVEERCSRQRHSVLGKFEVCSADTALKEAISQSLQYAKLKPEEKEESKDKKTSVKEDEAIVESFEKDDEEKTIKETTAEQKDEAKVKEEESTSTKDLKIADMEDNTNISHTKEASDNTEIYIADEVGDIKDKEEVDAEIIVEQKVEDNEDVSYAEDASVYTATKTADKIEEQKSLAALKLKEELALDDTPISQKTKKTNESSFIEDAEGMQGDITIAIDAVLDVTANGIDTVVSKVEKAMDEATLESQTQAGCTILGTVNTTNSNAVSEESSQTKSYFTADGIDTVVSKVEKTPDDTTLESQTQAGCTILGTVNTTNSNDVSEESSQIQASVDSNDEWQILNEDGQSKSDEMIAQATQLLGSALFQSDVISDVTEIKDEYTMATNHSIISQPSYAESVPTDISTIVSRDTSPSVSSRWDAELNQLHELGFLDDVKNMSVIEYLELANIAQGSKDAVTVNAVVDYLLSKYNEQY